MVQYQPLDRTFAALADPTRRDVLVRLRESDATIGALAEPHGISLTGMRKHVQVLEEAGLVTTTKVGRARICRLGPHRLDDAVSWIDTWRGQVSERLDRLAVLVEREKGTTP